MIRLLYLCQLNSAIMIIETCEVGKSRKIFISSDAKKMQVNVFVQS